MYYEEKAKYPKSIAERITNIMNKSSEHVYQNIYRLCFPRLVTYLQRRYACNLQDAEDIAAQALHILWEKWDVIESHSEAGLLRWLLLTAQNLMRDEVKKKRRRPELVSLEEMNDSQHPPAPPEQDEEEYAHYLTEIMQRLTESDAALFRAKIVEHDSDDAIAVRLGISVNTLRVRWLRVKRRILGMWDELKRDI